MKSPPTALPRAGAVHKAAALQSVAAGPRRATRPGGASAARSAAAADLIRLELRYRGLLEAAPDAMVVVDEAGDIVLLNLQAEKQLGYQRDELVGQPVTNIIPEGFAERLIADDLRSADDAVAQQIGTGIELSARRKNGTEFPIEIMLSPLESAEGILITAAIRDISVRKAAEAELRQLVAVVEQTSDPVIIVDLAGIIEYVNPAFELASGYSRAHAVGKSPRILHSGVQSVAFYRAMWRRLGRGLTWTGTLVNRRRDGSLYELDTTISPLRHPGGETTGYLGIQRDVTSLRAAESGLAREFRERAEVAAALARLQPAGSAEETAAVICDGLFGLHGIDVAMVVNFVNPDRAVPLAVSGPAGLPLAVGRPMPAVRARYLHGRASQGPWAEAWRPRPEDGAYGRIVAEIGIRAVAYAPIRNGTGLLGVVAAGTCDEAYVRHLIDRLPAVGEFAATASALLCRQLERGHQVALIQARVKRALRDGGLRPVFQPILELDSGRTVGFEALTRFADGTPPDRMIASAHTVGLGMELEVACLTAALQASEALPRDAWLSLNASPSLILDASELPALLAGRSRQFVIEVTEHAEIEDYAAVRRAVAGLGPMVSLAVDDAGSGFASLRHIVELAPKFLKADLSLVRHVNRDLTRQAMIAGLGHFAARVGCQVIAEGIEDAAELDMLREIGVPLGQGYLLGRPEAVSAATGGGVIGAVALAPALSSPPTPAGPAA